MGDFLCQDWNAYFSDHRPLPALMTKKEQASMSCFPSLGSLRKERRSLDALSVHIRCDQLRKQGLDTQASMF